MAAYSVLFQDHLLEELQKYVSGETVYIPPFAGKRKKMGERYQGPVPIIRNGMKESGINFIMEIV